MKLRLLGIAAVASLAMAGCATTSSPGYGYGTAPPPSSSSASCYDCGTVTRIEMTSAGTSTVPNATGAVLGGIVGAAAGRELADDESKGRRNTATVAGAVAGAVAGNAIQNNAQRNNGAAYNVHVRMNDGRTTVVSQADINGIREGSNVRVYNGRAWAR
ncbi:MAG: glycine zipper 2TM domain-containing protein [Luteimonas sp.]